MNSRFQRTRLRGARLPKGVIVVTRPTKYGNEFEEGIHGTKAECAALFRAGRLADLAAGGERERRVRAILAELRGRDLACWCPLGAPCHADVWLELVQAEGSR